MDDDQRSEDVLDAATHALDDFAGAFCCADSDILARRSSALAHRTGSIYGMQSDEVEGTFPSTRGQVAGRFTGALADIGTAAANVTAGAAAFLLRVYSSLGRGRTLI